MSDIGYCVRGGQSGIRVTRKEMIDYSRKAGTKYIDERIPLPGRRGVPELCPEEEHNGLKNVMYYECMATGSHGWCCSKCGKVLQWG
jgi:hypothetical protein